MDLRLTNWQDTGIGGLTLRNVEDVNTGDGDDRVVGNAHDNRIFTWLGNDTLDGGLGDDWLFGGTDTDTAVFADTAGATVNLSFEGERQNTGSGWDILYDIENLRGRAGNDHFRGDSEANLLEGAGGNDTLQGNAGNDTLDGGAGTDTAVFAGKRADYIIGSAGGVVTVTGQGARWADGIDQIKNIRFLKFADEDMALTNAAPTGPVLSSTTVVENAPVNSVAATLSATYADGDTITYSLVPGSSSAFTIIGNSLVITGAIDFEASPQHAVTVQATDPYGGVATTTVNLSVINRVEVTSFALRGTSRGGDLTGEAGADTLYGSLGNDVLTGGAGKDIFVFDTRLNKRTNVDQVLDFNSRDDSFYLDNATFTKLGSGTASRPKKFNSDMFVEGTRVRDAEDRIIYDKKTGKLYYDEDGTGSKAQIQIATLTNKAKLAYHDFFVV
ncbi:cadherin domain-containing protein [Microvirga sp. BSC39]|uniref:cadherin domain-containing protein n=1 Tax=Microvirga sp. BSC39 TaxID=1549810 RepID=UPI0004E96575|nr:cadherin domain-containing protein [Microvirga sp. BSC39]KFG69991.1 hypothetical protein JH26_07560 [Microvirga sp. BSC39]